MNELLTLGLYSAAVAIVAGIAQAASGFGFALVAIPLLALFIDIDDAVVGVTLLSTVFTIVASIRYRREADWARARRFTLAALVGLPVGLIALSLLDASILTGLVAILVLIFAWVIWRGLTVKPGRAVDLGLGVLSGLLLTSTGMNGPPLVAALAGTGLEPSRVRATLQATFAAQDILAMLGFIVIGQLSPQVFAVTAGGLPGILLGWVLGDQIFKRVSAVQFRGILFFMLLACSTVLIIRAIA